MRIFRAVAVLSAALFLSAAPLANGFKACGGRNGSRPGLCMSTENNEEKPKGFFANFFSELDRFVDDATSRRLGNGAAFYGKRKSSFYGDEDTMKKRDPTKSDPLEDYRVQAGGYFVWRRSEETGQLEPQTRMKGRRLDAPPPPDADE